MTTALPLATSLLLYSLTQAPQTPCEQERAIGAALAAQEYETAHRLAGELLEKCNNKSPEPGRLRKRAARLARLWPKFQADPPRFANKWVGALLAWRSGLGSPSTQEVEETFMSLLDDHETFAEQVNLLFPAHLSILWPEDTPILLLQAKLMAGALPATNTALVPISDRFEGPSIRGRAKLIQGEPLKAGGMRWHHLRIDLELWYPGLARPLARDHAVATVGHSSAMLGGLEAADRLGRTTLVPALMRMVMRYAYDRPGALDGTPLPPPKPKLSKSMPTPPEAPVLPTPPQPAPTERRILLLDIKADNNVNPNLLRLSHALLAKADAQQPYDIISINDIAASIETEKAKDLLGCADVSCVSDIAGALGTRWLMHGTLGGFGKSLILSLTLTDNDTTDSTHIDCAIPNPMAMRYVTQTCAQELIDQRG